MGEIDRWFQQNSRSRSRSRERSSSYSSDLSRSGMGRPRGEGLYDNGKCIGDDKRAVGSTRRVHSSAEVNTLKSVTQKANGTPMKMLIDEEMLKELEPKRSAPSVIARLMGLDALPIPQHVNKHRKESEAWSKEGASMGFKEKRMSQEDHSFRVIREQQEFKDVFEVLETSNFDNHKNPSNQKGLPKVSRSDKDINFIRQKFLDAKRLSTDEKLQNSKEFSDALDVLDSNKDIFLKFLQEPNSLFTKHLQDLRSSPSQPQLSRITLLKPSKVTKSESSDSLTSEGKAESHTEMEKDAMNCLPNYGSSPIGHSVSDRSASRSSKLTKSNFEGTEEHCPLPTRIVVLKPSFEKVQNADRAVPLPTSMEKGQLGYRRQKEYRRSGSHKLFSEARDREKFSNNVESLRDRGKGSREIAKEILKNRRHPKRSGSSNVCTSGQMEFPCNGSSHKMLGKAAMLECDSMTWTSGNFDDWNGGYTSLPFHSTESSVSREARRHLSERCRTSRRFQKVGLIDQCSSTLGEMLALSDRETTNMASVSESQSRWNFPSGISSRDGWKDGSLKKLSRSRSLPASSNIYASSKVRSRAGSCGNGDSLMLKDALSLSSGKSPEGDICNQKAISSQKHGKGRSRKLPLPDSTDEENEPSIREISVNPDDQRNRIDLTQDRHLHSEPSASGFFDATPLADDIKVTENIASGTSQGDGNELPVTDVLMEPAGNADYHNTIFTKEMSPDHSQGAMSFLSSPHHREPESPSKDALQPSPVSVLDPPNEDGESSPECFEKLSADLQELRMQLQLLKLESTGTDADGSDMFSDEETGGDCVPLPQTIENPQMSTDKDDRDLSYLFDMLTDSSLDGATLDTIFDACYLPESPVDPDIFEKLEKVYDEPAVWSRAERKFLFDLINSLLNEVFEPHMDLHPWVKPGKKVRVIHGPKVLADEVWQLLKRKRELSGSPAESILDSRWLDVRDDIDIIGREIEKMLRDDLLDELVSEFVF